MPRKSLSVNGIRPSILIPILLFIVLVPATVPLLGIDNVPFLKEYLMVFLLGAGFYPVTGCIFSEFTDRGWLFSKAVGLFAAGTLFALLNAFGKLRITFPVAIGAVLLLILICQLAGLFQRDGKKVNYTLIVWEELFFFGVFLLWTYLCGFHPEAYDGEKFIQYGVFAAMERSGSCGISNLWFSGDALPASYQGIWFGVVLSILSGVAPAEGFNLYHAFLAACTACFPFSLVYAMLLDKMRLRGEIHQMRRDYLLPAAGGILAGGAACLAGNLHYVWYGLLGVVSGRGGNYWFPDSTRYIGYQTEAILDRTIHEFPAYDFVIGDLSPNVCALPVTLTLLALAYSIIIRDQETVRRRYFTYKKAAWGNPAAVLFGAGAGILLAIHPQILPLYLLLFFGSILTGSMTLIPRLKEEGWIGKLLETLGIRTLEALIPAVVAVSGFWRVAEHTGISLAIPSLRSSFASLLLLWGLPFCLFLTTMGAILLRWTRMGVSGKGRFLRYFTEILTPDHFFLLLGILFCVGVLIPELVYVRDIYETGYPRAYTMKYFTWEAFLCGAILMAYAIGRLISWKKEPILHIFGAIGALLLVLTMGYFGNASASWYGRITDLSSYRGLDATAYVDNLFAKDAQAIHWLDQNTKEQTVLLEADSESYSYGCRYSALTGHAIPLGWHIHSRLWGRSTEENELRAFDVKTMFTSEDVSTVEDLLDYYQIEYMILDSAARDKYGEELKEEALTGLADPVYADENVTILKRNLNGK